MSPARPSKFFLICLLGSLSVISPFAIDMYLPAFPQMAADFGVSTGTIAMTISSYFIGLALGQVFYGPLLDRFGRKKPLFFGLGLFIATALACTQVGDAHALVALRFVQALGGCAAGVASLAMVRDLFPVNESAKILSRLFLFIALSPLLAPSVGGMLIAWFGWQAIFYVLAGVVCLILTLLHLFLPETHKPDTGISLRPADILAEYGVIIRYAPFIVFAMAGAFSFAGLFTYVAGSPIIFMEEFGLGPQAYSIVFACLSTGFIGGSQLNVALLRRFDSVQLFRFALGMQTVMALCFCLATLAGAHSLPLTIGFFFVFLGGAGITYPNAAATALAPFTRNAGSAAALLGFLQLGIGSLISTGIGLFNAPGSLPISILLAITTSLACAVLLAGHGAVTKARAIAGETAAETAPAH